MELTNQQSQAIKYIVSLLMAGEDAALVGYAGTGKTTTATELIKLLPSGWEVTFCAYTNKATQVIERMLAYKGLAAQCKARTIHSILNLNKEYIDQKTGERKFVKSNNPHTDLPKDESKHLLVIDEMGTVPCNEQAPLALMLLQLDNPKLFMGDRCQLPPVSEEYGVLFDLLDGYTTYLYNVVRYDGAILQAATELRQKIKSYDALEVLENENDGDKGVFKVSSRQLKQAISKFIKEDEYKENKDFFKIITYTNKAMDYWNDLVRYQLYAEQSERERFIVGSRIVALESCIAKEEVTCYQHRGKRTVKLMSSSEEGVIQNVIKGNCDLEGFDSPSLGLQTYYIEVTTEYGAEVTLHVIDENYEEKLKRVLKDLAAKRKWKEFYLLKDYFHNINDAYSLTIQRMQGSTCQHVVLDTENFNTCDNIWRRNRMFYTGLTRAEKRVYI